MTRPIPVIAIDGPTASGKGTVAAAVAARLGFHYLDSGALYRIVALAALRTTGMATGTTTGTITDTITDTTTSSAAANDRSLDPATLAHIAMAIDPAFVEGKILENGEDITLAIRTEAVSQTASRCAVFPEVRQALLERQRAFRRPPGLVADGRDMGTVVFTDAPLKVYLTASAEERAQRRHKQLIAKGIPATLDGLLRDLRERDARDSGRADAPLVAAADALVIDTTGLSIVAATDRIVEAWETGRETRRKAGSGSVS